MLTEVGDVILELILILEKFVCLGVFFFRIVACKLDGVTGFRNILQVLLTFRHQKLRLFNHCLMVQLCRFNFFNSARKLLGNQKTLSGMSAPH
jgi:hypothetical protein